jgi:hypothetical protein
VGNNAQVNKQLVLSDNSASDAVSTATNFYGFGVNSFALRYQTTSTSSTHKFYCGTTNAYTITNTGGANGSDARWKTEVENITNAMALINQLQGKTFVLNDDSKRQMGFIAQEVKEVCPEVVVVDDSDENQWHFMQYDKLTALLCEGIKEQHALITDLTSRLTNLESQMAALQGNQP